MLRRYRRKCIFLATGITGSIVLYVLDVRESKAPAAAGISTSF